ncbi:vacuolar protein-sorting-associated protein 37 homolog 1-like [Amaranthus tricolor]|uniref:vacuolar protein-sorting-associated protein 37 homolog 1-like n=1 Tax=Amaranthus tricolor TaxID=29722 RepID=UPI00258A507D|nr:vacuolar protein-sorting-associated protein 37 homolog 1-like [Amaranthus tricolor]XP_057536566.1 vacuolar protein-sorting-associated protein 37 homolog 1-like [Amaranthus tricolor]XP_057536567.1 vacuolar protein-sorting-associated protein 37 homolog 1-like [Amaranthus tricolor]
MFKFWGSQDQGSQSRPEYAQSSYPSSVVDSPSSSRLSETGSNLSNNFNPQKPSDRPDSGLHVSPSEAAEIISTLRDKSVDELRKLLNDKEAYNRYFLSLDQIKTQNNVRDELRKATLQLARENLEKEPQIIELRNQCRIIRTSELADAQEKLNGLERRKEEIMKCYSPASLLQQLQEAINQTDQDSEALHRQFLDREIELGAFIQKYKKLRSIYHRQSLTHLAAKTSSSLG